MRVIIVEDELPAGRKLKAMLQELDPTIRVDAILHSVQETAEWIRTDPNIDLGFFDIQLSDDISFRVFEQVEVNFPVVFITAYDEYLMEAFDHNSIYYLLKPVTAEKLEQALRKAEKLEKHFTGGIPGKFAERADRDKTVKSRLVVRKGLDYAPIETADIAYLFTEHKLTFVRDHRDGLYMMDQPLTEIGKMLDPREFFRANRQYIINIKAIRKFRTVEQSRIHLELSPPPKEEVLISKENAVIFRKWIER